MRFGLGLALLSAATFGTSGTFARALIEAGWSAEAAVAARIGIAALVLAVPAAIALRARWSALRRHAGQIAVFGLLAVGGAQVGFFNAIRYLPVGVALLLEYSGIVLVVLWMWLVHGERPRRRTVAGAVAALAGLLLVLDLTGGVTVRFAGVAWGLLAAAGLAAYFVVSGRLDHARTDSPAAADRELPSVALASAGMGLGCLLLVLLGVAGAVPWHAGTGQVSLAGTRTSWLVPLAGVSLVAAVVAYVAGIGAARILGAGVASFVGLTEVLFAVVFAWIFLGELPTVKQAVGGVLVIVGIVLVRLDALSASPVVRDPMASRNA